MIYIGNGLYSDSGPSLQHYGVIGMKWGIRNDKQFRKDIHRHEANEKIRAARKLLKGKEIDKSEFKRQHKAIRAEEKARNKAMKNDYKGMKAQRGVSRKTIYEANMKKAQELIPHYKAKHAVRKAVSIGTKIGMGVAATYPGVIAAAGAVTMAQAASSAAMANGARLLAGGLGWGIGAAANTAVQGKIGKNIMNNKL